MSHNSQFYIDGAWVDPVVAHPFDVIDPSNEDAFAQISLGSKADVDKAVAAAKRAFATYGFTSPAERLALLQRIVEVYKKRSRRSGSRRLARNGRAARVCARAIRSASAWLISKK